MRACAMGARVSPPRVQDTPFCSRSVFCNLNFESFYRPRAEILLACLRLWNADPEGKEGTAGVRKFYKLSLSKHITHFASRKQNGRPPQAKPKLPPARPARRRTKKAENTLEPGY